MGTEVLTAAAVQCCRCCSCCCCFLVLRAFSAVEELKKEPALDGLLTTTQARDSLTLVRLVPHAILLCNSFLYLTAAVFERWSTGRYSNHVPFDGRRCTVALCGRCFCWIEFRTISGRNAAESKGEVLRNQVVVSYV